MAFGLNLWTYITGGAGILALLVGFLGGRKVKKKDAVKVLGAALVLFTVLAGFGLINLGTASIGGGGNSNPAAPIDLAGCPTDGDSNLKINVVNSANESGSEGYDVTGYLYKKTSAGLTYIMSITDTTDATAGTYLIDCGADYVFKIISTSGASGDGSYVKQIRSGDGRIDADGNLEFTAKSSNPSFILGVDQNAAIQVRAWDNIQSAFMCNTDDLCTDYETDGVTFTSTTNNTAMDETLGIDFELQLKATDTADNANDRGILVLLEMPSSTWSASPKVYANGIELTEMKASLTPFEATAYSGYEYAYLIPRSMVLKDGSEGITLRLVNSLAAGVSTSSADPEIDLAPRGAYLGIDSIGVGYGAVKDDSSRTQVNTLFDITIDVT